MSKSKRSIYQKLVCITEAIKMHFSIVWRRWHDYEDGTGKKIKTYIDWKTAWKVSKDLWIN